MGGSIEPSAVTVNTTVMCRFSAPVLRIILDFTPTRSIVLPGTNTGVSSMFPINALGNLPLFRSFCAFCRYNFIFPSNPDGSLCESEVFALGVNLFRRKNLYTHPSLALKVGTCSWINCLTYNFMIICTTETGRCRSLISSTHWASCFSVSGE